MQIISVITTLILCFLILMNFQDTAGITLLSSKIATIFSLTPRTLTMNMALYTLIIFILGEASAIFFFVPFRFLPERFLFELSFKTGVETPFSHRKLKNPIIPEGVRHARTKLPSKIAQKSFFI